MVSRKRKVAMLSVYSNTFLVAIKFITGFLMGSVSVISEGIHSAIDLVAAIIANYSVKKSEEPADQQHPYGHGKFENYAGVIEAILIFIAAAIIVYESGQRLIFGSEVEFLAAGLVIMALSAVINYFVSRKLYQVGKEEDSMALVADGLHLKTDVLTSIGVFLGLMAITITGWTFLDPIIAIGVALLIVKASINLTREASKGLVDETLPEEDLSKIETVLYNHREYFEGFHALRTRKSGAERFIDLHLVMRPDVKLNDAFRVCRHLEDEIGHTMPKTNVMIRCEPSDFEDAEGHLGDYYLIGVKDKESDVDERND